MASNAPGTIGTDTRVSGIIHGSDPLHIEGTVEGRVELDNVLTVAQSGHVKADVSAREVVIEGHVEGKISAHDRVVLRKNAQADGDIVTPRIVVEDGSIFNGNLYMNSPPGPEEE